MFKISFNILALIVFLVLLSFISIWSYSSFMSNNSLAQDKNMLMTLVSVMGYSTESASFRHEKAPWGSIESNHDYLLVHLKTEETADDITQRLEEHKLTYTIPKTINHGVPYTNYWLINHGDNSIILQLKSGTGINDSIRGKVTTPGPRYLELYYNRNK